MDKNVCHCGFGHSRHERGYRLGGQRLLRGREYRGFILLSFAATLVLVHGFVVFGAARLLRIDVDIAAVASQANVGGSTSALARSLGRADLVLPAVLIGSLGNAIGRSSGSG